MGLNQFSVVTVLSKDLITAFQKEKARTQPTHFIACAETKPNKIRRKKTQIHHNEEQEKLCSILMF